MMNDPGLSGKTEHFERPAALLVKTFPVGPLQCNCTILGDPETGDAILVDPGGDADRILETLNQHHLTVRYILHTHAHFDHFLASGEIKRATGAILALHPADRPLWDNLDKQCGLFGFESDRHMPPPDHALNHEENISVQQIQGRCLHTPGHTPGSMCFYFESLNLLLGGDTLFRRSIGRTDLWGGDAKAIEQSIRQRLYTLDEATEVITGHGPSTTIAEEIRHNPFVPG